VIVNLQSPIQKERPDSPAGAERRQGSSPRLQHLFERRAGRKWLAAIAAAAFPALIGLCFLTLPFLQGPVNYSYDLPFYFRPSHPVDEVVVLYMDERSETVLGQGRWDKWDRTVHARLIRKLTGAGAKAVVFDVVFGEDANAIANRELTDAARENGKVVVAAINGFRVHAGEIIGSEIIKPFDELAAVTAWGMSEASDASKAVREHYRDTVFQIPSLAWRAAELVHGKLESDPFARHWFNFYGPPGYLPHQSYSDVFEKDFDLVTAFSNKVVFVGALWSVGFTGGKGTDDFRIPHTLWTGRKAPGVEVNATAYLNLVRGDSLSRPSPLVEASLLTLFGALVGFYFISLRPVTAVWVGILSAGGVAGLGIISVLTTQIWFPWLIPAALQIPCAVGGALFIHTRRLQREMNLLEQEVALAGRVNAAAAPPLDAGRTAPKRTVSLPPPDDFALSVPDHELLRPIGKGAYGEVWLARDIIGSYHAVKIVHRKVFQDDGPYEREFRGISRFTPISRSHAGFIHVLHVGRSAHDDYIYYVMELGDDETQGQQINPESYVAKTLKTELRRRHRLPLPECLDIAMQLAEALQHLHEHKLIHRDIKPANIIFVKGSAKFADIGLVTDAATGGASVTYLGTKGYIAPEGPGTPMADIYSLGKLIYEIGFGLAVAHYPELPTDVIGNTDNTALFELNRIVLKACDANPAKRHQSAAELHRGLAELRQQSAASSPI
jgi:CHASE2 domain-containing sensor protein